MIKALFKTKDRRLIGIYILATALIYGAFWATYYLARDIISITAEQMYFLAGLLALLGFLPLVIRVKDKEHVRDAEECEEQEEKEVTKEQLGENLFIFHPKFPYIPFISIAVLNTAIGIVMSAVFLQQNIVPSRFFGLVLLIMLGIKIGQLLFGEFLLNTLKAKWLFSFFTAGFILAEIAACFYIIPIFLNDAAIGLQLLFTGLLCVFYSLGQIHVRKKWGKSFWDEAAVAYMYGFIYVIVVLVIVGIMIATKGEALEGVGDIGIEIGSSKAKKKKPVQSSKDVI